MDSGDMYLFTNGRVTNPTRHPTHHEDGDIVGIPCVPEPGEGADVVPAEQGVDSVYILDSVDKY